MSALGLSWLACFTYVFMEWLFFVTKPSILSYFTLFEKLSTLFLSPLIILAVLAPLVLVLAFAAGKAGRFYSLNLAIPSLVLAATMLLLVENFTYTVFGFNLGGFTGLSRYAYGLGFALAAVYLGWWLHRATAGNKPASGLIVKAAAVTGAPAVCFALLSFAGGKTEAVEAEVSGAGRMPNILILSSDGINARNMSAYGYERETTPFIESLLDESLVFENHFTNAANTTGSVMALFTGKLPTTTRVIYPPDTLRDADAYQHLPGMLRKLGYTNSDISIRNYADSRDLNLLEGFDTINGREYGGGQWTGWLFSLLQRAFPSESLFLNRTGQRITGRFLHMAGVRDMENPFRAVTEPERESGISDDQRMRWMYEFISGAEQPFFAHVHLLGTHGPTFRPKDPFFSRGREQHEPFMTDFYDDAIRDYDAYVREAVDFLKNRGLYDNTLLILTSDHGIQSYAGRTVPLIMRFPGGQLTGSRSAPSQRIDIAPTILDYLNVTAPAWMEGDSLFSPPENARRPIFATRGGSAEVTETGTKAVADPEPPFYTLGRFSLIDCQYMYYLNLPERQLSRRAIPEHTAPCARQSLLSHEQALDIMLSHLDEKGYETGDIPFQYPETYWLDELSGSVPVMRDDIFYIPAVEFRGEIYAVVLEQNGDFFELLEAEYAWAETDAVFFDNETNTLRLEGVESGGNRYSVRFRMVNDDPIKLELVERKPAGE